MLLLPNSEKKLLKHAVNTGVVGGAGPVLPGGGWAGRGWAGQQAGQAGGGAGRGGPSGLP